MCVCFFYCLCKPQNAKNFRDVYERERERDRDRSRMKWDDNVADIIIYTEATFIKCTILWLSSPILSSSSVWQSLRSIAWHGITLLLFVLLMWLDIIFLFKIYMHTHTNTHKRIQKVKKWKKKNYISIVNQNGNTFGARTGRARALSLFHLNANDANTSVAVCKIGGSCGWL